MGAHESVQMDSEAPNPPIGLLKKFDAATSQYLLTFPFVIPV